METPVIKTLTPMDFDEMKRIVEILLTQGRGKEAMMLALPSFLLVRYSDYSRLRYKDFEGERIILGEQKTKKVRNIKINQELRDIVKRAKPTEATPETFLLSNANNSPHSIQYVNQELRKLKNEFTINSEHFSTHSLLKTGCLRIFDKQGRSEAALILLSKIRNHSSVGLTIGYLGIGQKNIDNAFDNL